MKRVILTGSTGFIGANLARRLLRDGHEVHVLLRYNCNPWRIADIREEVHLHEVNLRDRDLLAQVIGEIRPEWVFHLAVNGAYSWQSDLHQMVQTNILGTVNLVEACLQTGFEVFLNTGSSSEYGFKETAPSENDWLDPNSYYAVTKASASLFCRHIAVSRKVNLHTLRLYSVYGPYEEPSRFVPALVIQGLKGRLPKLVSASVARDFIYVEDVVDAYLVAATKAHQQPGAIYNIGTGVQTTIAQAVEIARRSMNIPAAPRWGTMPDRSWDTSTWMANTEFTSRQLSWKSRHDFEQGLRRTIAWFQDNPSMLDWYEKALARQDTA
jgi:nucleoside-diphosphate-sugar epimerase